MSTTDERLALAARHEAATRELLEQRGWATEPFGQALLSERMRTLLRRTRSRLRWMPDLIACRGSRVILVDAKDALRTDTANWTLEIAAFEAGSAFQASFGHPLLYVWHDYTANFHDDLKIEATFGERSYTAGSGTPFYLIRKADQLALDDVLQESESAAS